LFHQLADDLEQGGDEELLFGLLVVTFGWRLGLDFCIGWTAFSATSTV